MARRRTKVDKLIDDLEVILNDVYFHPSLMANMITTTYPPYTQAKLIELIRSIEKYHQKELDLDKTTQSGQFGPQR
jgi:hypothetical protein